MIEAASDSEAAPLSESMPPAGLTAGRLLRDAREAAGLHVAALAVSLKVPVSKLEALEQDRYESLPDAVFTRALAAAICRNLKIDPGPVLERLPQTAAPRLVRDTDGINAPFRSPRDGIAPDWREHLTRPVSLTVGALLVGVLVVILWPATPVQEGAVAAANSEAAPVAAATATATALPAEAPAATMAVLQAPAATGRSAPSDEPAASAPVAAATASAAAAPATAASGIVVFRTSGAAWVEVRDAKGVVVVRKLMAPGEAAAASGAVPLQVVVGKVDATEVQVRGQSFDLRPHARDNVARFEVK
jgi:cytoskeleton protein RodZ